MKSQQQERLIKTSCYNCSFAIYNDKTQTGCVFDRTNKFDDIVEAYNEDKEFYVLNRLCNYYRNKSWGYSDSDVAKVEEESSVSFDVLLYYSQLDSDKINKIISLISNKQYYKNKITFTLFHDYEKDSDVKPGLLEIVQSVSQDHNRMNISICYILDKFLLSFFHKTRNDFHFILKDDEILDFNIDMIIDINDHINDKFKKALFFKRNSVNCVHNFAYKSISLQDENMSHEDKVSALLEISQKQNLFVEI